MVRFSQLGLMCIFVHTCHGWLATAAFRPCSCFSTVQASELRPVNDFLGAL